MPGKGYTPPTPKKPVIEATPGGTTSGAAGWQGGGIPEVTFITSTIPTAANPNNVEKITQTALVRKFLEMSPQERIAVGNRLKSAGYNVGNLTGQATRQLRSAYVQAYQDLNDEILVGQQLDFNTFLARESGARGGGREITPRAPYVQESEINEQSARALIDAIFSSEKGRKATEDEYQRNLALIRKQQRRNPLVTTYTTDMKTGQVTGSKTTGGFGEQEAQQFLVDRIAKDDEAKAYDVLNYYSRFMRKLGLS